MSWFEAIAGAASSLLGGSKDRGAVKKEAQVNRDFQESLSNTAYQRAMADMGLAGLNPILAGKLGGATTPTGAMANLAGTWQNSINSAAMMFKTASDIGLNNARSQLAETDQVLREALVPGMESISIVTTEIKKMVEIVSGALSPGGSQDYQQLLNEVQEKTSRLFDKLEQVGGSVTNTYNTVIESGGQINENVKSWFRDIIDRNRNTNTGD